MYQTKKWAIKGMGAVREMRGVGFRTAGFSRKG